METTASSQFVLRIVASSTSDGPGREFSISGTGTIGRDKDCAVVLSDASVSRRHARVERTHQGIRLTDLDSGNGVWMGTERVTETLLEPGQQFRIGSTVLEYPAADLAEAEEIAPPPTVPMSRPAPERETVSEETFLLRLVGSAAGQAGRDFRIEGGSATIGRAQGCTVVLDDRTVSRRHARIEVTPGGFLITDLGSSGGVWVDKRRVDEAVLEAGQPFSLGEYLVMACHRMGAVDADPAVSGGIGAVETEPAISGEQGPPPLVELEAGVRADSAPMEPAVALSAAEPEMDEDVDFEGTVVMPAPPELLLATRRIEDEGELQEVSAHRPFLLDDASSLWYVVTGGIEIFTVEVQQGKPVGTRAHFLGILSGQCFFGFDLLSLGMGSGFLAVAKGGTTLRRIQVARLRELATSPHQAAAVASLVDTWVAGLSKALTRDLNTKRVDETLLRPGEHVELGSRTAATSAEGVVWIDTWSGSLLFDDLATPVFNEKRVLLPVSPDSWIQPVSDEFGELSLTPIATVDAIATPSVWLGLDVFHALLCECEFINKKLATVDEYVRLQQKAEVSEKAQQAAYDAIGSVLRSEAATPREFFETGATEPVLRACEVVGRTMGMTMSAHLDDIEELTYEEKIAAIASSSGCRLRVVALRDQWWTQDQSSFLAQIEKTKTPVAVVPTGPTSYECIDPNTDSRTKVDAEVAASLAPFAYTFYRPFPDGKLKVSDVVRFGGRGLFRDFRLVILMGLVVGILGTFTPWVTGKIFDDAIPQAEQPLLFTFGLGMFATAVATSLFKITQGIATVRVQGRMEYAIQSALWDRLLNLPANFFRQYSAGDLAERVGGVDAIQSLLSGAGVAAILGSLSGLAYFVLMFTYNMRLALAAVALSASFVTFTFVANYLQLTYQRREIQIKGRLTGLVLNLINGVTRIRICGAEHHAFRVWAQQFSQQRRISFTVGTIQNAVAVFTSIFPILSSLTIFYMMLVVQRGAVEAGTPGITAGDFIAFSAAFGLFLAAMQAMGDASMNLLRIMPIYERLRPIVETPAEVDSSKIYPGKLKGEIELSHLHFRYDANGPWIIKDVSLKINAGEFVAFVGGSGCGKSTLLRLMLGFEPPTMGSVRYDGQDLSSLDSRMVRQQMGVVLQASRVMPTEMYRNIIGISSRTVEDAWRAAEMSGLAQDIRDMPMGMHTYVSEGGGTLSGGQRQRLMIARAVVNAPKILFLDEATSALDNHTQATVTEAMDKMESTRIVIAHRLSTVMNADKICYLEGGGIAEMGTYDELMALDGLFAKLAKRQIA